MGTYLVKYKSSMGNGERVVVANDVYDAHAKGQPNSGRVVSITHIPDVVESITPQSEEVAIEAAHADPVPETRENFVMKKRGRPKR